MYYTHPTARFVVPKPDIYLVDNEYRLCIRVVYVVSTDKRMLGGGGGVVCYGIAEERYVGVG